VTFRLDVGPVLRTLRRRPAVFTMLVVEVAAGVAALTALLLAASWYGIIGAKVSSFDEANLALVSTYTPGATEGEVASRQREDLARVRGIPGVASASAVSNSILDERWLFPALFRTPETKSHGVGWPIYTDDTAPRTLKLRTLAGQLPDAAGAGDGGPVRTAAITLCLARALFGSPADAIGHTITSEHTVPVRVDAVVENVTMRNPFMPHPACILFLFGGAPADHDARLIVRAAPGQRDAVLARLSAAFADAAPHRWAAVQPLDSKVGVAHHIGQGVAMFLSIFGAMVGLIAQLGALAATSFLVAQRRRQIGIRRALGATRADIIGQFLLENAVTMLVGSLLGLVGTALLYGIMQRFFKGLVVDVLAIAAGVVLFWVATLAATLIPAHRAARVPPSVASRSL
jgi:putative ABC transport system permease protein